MRIGIDALPLLGRAGIGNHQRSLLRALLMVAPRNQYDLVLRSFNSDLVLKSFLKFPQVFFHRLPFPNRVLELFWTKHRWPLPTTGRFFDSLDVYFATGLVVPVLKKPIVSVIYDLIPLKFEEYKNERPMFLSRIKRIIRHSSYIVTSSQSTKNDLGQIGDIASERIIPIPLAADPRFYSWEDRRKVEAVLQRYSLGDQKYILYVGNMGPHKNVTTLVEVFCSLKNRQRIPHKLVLCGQKKWGGKVLERIQNLKIQEDIMVLDYVPD
ncbi:MAG: glycosyltransferase, partial [Candidatus Omnitrophica bacterium]|nr:glycosyltransferase [Candidatus Omnitrophota bacterium]